MVTMLTEEDVRAAHTAFVVNADARTQEITPQDAISSCCVMDHEAGHCEECVAANKEYAHGARLLRDYIVLMSARSTAGGRFDDAAMERVVSPIITVSSGHIGTAEAYRAVALAQR